MDGMTDLAPTTIAAKRLALAMIELNRAFASVADVVGADHVQLALCCQWLEEAGIPMAVEDLRELVRDAKANPLAIGELLGVGQ